MHQVNHILWFSFVCHSLVVVAVCQQLYSVSQKRISNWNFSFIVNFYFRIQICNLLGIFILEFSIRHSQSEPVINRSQNHCRVYIEPFELEPLDLNSNSNLTTEKLNDNEIDTNLLYPNWFSCSSISITSITSTIDSLETRSFDSKSFDSKNFDSKSFDSKSISTEDLIHEMITIEGLRTLYSSCFTYDVY